MAQVNVAGQDRPALPCEQRTGSWDLDVGGAEEWLLAVDSCARCPRLATCRALRDSLYPPPRRPAGVIWAGIAYGDDSRPLTEADIRRRQDRRSDVLDEAS